MKVYEFIRTALLHLSVASGLRQLVRIRGLSAGVAATSCKDGFFGTAAAAGNEAADSVEELAREVARVDLTFTAHTAPAHPIIIIVTALNGASSALVVEQDTSEPLKLEYDMQKLMSVESVVCRCWL